MFAGGSLGDHGRRAACALCSYSGYLVYVLKRVVARFGAGVSRGQIDSLLESLGAEVVLVQNAGSGYITYIIEPSPGPHGDVLKIADAIYESSMALWGSPEMVDPTMGPTSLLLAR